VLSESAPLPFPVDEYGDANEEIRLKHRYLDLRRPGPAAALRLRSEANRIARTVLAERDFVEVETPTLTRSTPEGARDFLVPARLRPGSWYALPQSPQLFKQLLMVAGLERYFQIARCYRDEDFRADRQPEFTQLDIEMSFVEQDDVIELGEAIVGALWSRLASYDIPRPIPRLTYAESMARYGTDKPDLRFGNELVECTDYFAQTPFRVFQAAYVIRWIGVCTSCPASFHSSTRISSDSVMMSSWSTKLISMSSWVNSGWRSARKSSSR
jgi:aspartyl-tRNA synthetase